MAMDLATFRASYKEFDGESDVYVQAKLDLAETRTSVTAWGDHFDDAHGLEAAHLLWESPFGATMRQDGDDKDERKSRYQKQRERLAALVIDTSCVVTGCPRVL
jgi:hypothetical protein